MKKISILSVLCICSMAVFGQLKVLSTDDVHIGYNTAVADPIYKFLMGKPQYLYTIGGGPMAGTQVYTDARWVFEMGGNSSEYLHIYSGGAKNSTTPYRFYMAVDGRVGIGKVPVSTAKLDVAGGIAVSGTIVHSSDARLKRNIKPASGLVPHLYSLEGKSYTKILSDSSENFKEYGFFAQELQEFYPELVSQDSAGYLSVNYIGLIPVIVEALKEQKKELETQKEQINYLLKTIGNGKLKGESINFIEENAEIIPLLYQNNPNPFNKSTEISFYIPKNVQVANLYIYDMYGMQKKSFPIKTKGNGSITLNASSSTP
ncbi:hypothetical protein FACS189434_11510 [Bacteroidia bacterium]|nr:hypothetical protein FACS189434_11510 [Bacteroidia bacterium]